jgi:hypothetical protein
MKLSLLLMLSSVEGPDKVTQPGGQGTGRMKIIEISWYGSSNNFVYLAIIN